jgi:hypothetical protein
MHDEKSIWRSKLQTALASEFNSGQVSAMMKDYDLLAGKMNPETAFSIAHASWSGGDTEKAVRTVKEYIAAQLGQFAASHRGIDKNPATRLKQVIKILNENIDKCSILINGQPLSASEIQKIKAVVPKCLSSPTVYEARANQGSKPALVIEVTI